MSECVKSATYRGVEVLSTSECREIAERNLKAKEVEVVAVKTAPLSEIPAGFLGAHYLVTITISNKKQTSEIKLFVKTIPNCPMHSDFALQIGSYRKETNFFAVLMHDLLKYRSDLKEDSGNIQHDWTCECYFTTPEKIVLDDLSARGFRNHALGTTSMDQDHCELVLKSLASFHASSIVFEEKETQRTGQVCRLNEVYPDQFTEIIWINDEQHPCYKLYVIGVQCSSAMIKHLPGWDGDEERHEELVKRMWASYADTCSFMAKPSTRMRNVVSHGDLWSNNILFRYDENSGKPLGVKFVDFQILRYTEPAHDVLSFLHLNTRRHLRDQHLLDFARTYHEALRAELSRHNLSVDDIVPWEQFKTSLEQYREMAALTASMYAPFVNIDPEVMTAMSRSTEVWKKFMFEDRTEVTVRWFEKDPTFKEVLTECLEELMEYLALRKQK